MRYEKHKEKISEQNALYRAANKEKIKAQQAEWRKNNKRYIKEANMRRTSGMTLVDYERKLEEQNYRCAICENCLLLEPLKRIHGDHCHVTGQPRGILCHECNTGIGLLQDDPDLLRAAINYLEKWRTK